jgi:hypothetical protein
MAPGNKINLAIYDGEQVYLHSNYADSLYLCFRENTLLFCTVPLTENEAWKKIRLNTLFSLRDGDITKEGTPHNNTYIDTEEDVKRLYAIYANL